MPPEVPPLIKSRIGASLGVRKLRLFTSAGARSPPLPPSPWHPPQTLSNCLCAGAKSEAGTVAVCAIPCAAISAAVINALGMFFVIIFWDQLSFGRDEYWALLISAKLG